MVNMLPQSIHNFDMHTHQIWCLDHNAKPFQVNLALFLQANTKAFYSATADVKLVYAVMERVKVDLLGYYTSNQ